MLRVQDRMAMIASMIQAGGCGSVMNKTVTNFALDQGASRNMRRFARSAAGWRPSRSLRQGFAGWLTGQRRMIRTSVAAASRKYRRIHAPALLVTQ